MDFCCVILLQFYEAMKGHYKVAVISRFDVSFNITRFLCMFKTDYLRTFQYSLKPLPPVQGQKVMFYL